MESTKEMHRDEIELLQNILFESLQILDEDPFHVLEIHILPDITEEPKINLTFKIHLTEGYPTSSIFDFTLSDKSNLIPSSKIKHMEGLIHEYFRDNIGTPIIFQLIEIIKDQVNEAESKLQEEGNCIEITAPVKKSTKHEAVSDTRILLETKKFTPVTEDSYNEWLEGFKKDMIKQGGKELKERNEILARTSGREFFMKMKNKDLLKGIDEEEEQDEDIKDSEDLVDQDDIDVDAFKEEDDLDLDEIDFDEV